MERKAWDVKEIEKREEELVKQFCKIWPSAEDFLGKLDEKDTEPTSAAMIPAKTDQTEGLQRGVVNSVNQQKRYGRIKPDTDLGGHPMGIYVDISHFPNQDINSLQLKQKVKFNIISTKKGLQAIDVAHIEDEE